MNKTDWKILIELICDKQIDIILKNKNGYESDKYKKLEILKVRIVEKIKEEY